LPDDSRAVVYFIAFDDPQTEKQRIITVDRNWFPARRGRRDDAQGLWPCVGLAECPPSTAPVPHQTPCPQYEERYEQRVASSLVLFNFDMPYSVSGVSDRYYYGTGLIADAERGWVIVDRNTVPVAMGVVRITFAGSLEIPG